MIYHKVGYLLISELSATVQISYWIWFSVRDNFLWYFLEKLRMGLNFEHLLLSAEGYKLTKHSCVVFQLLFASKLQIYGESAYINNCEINNSIYGEASVVYFHVLIQRATVQRRFKKNENKCIYFLKWKCGLWRYHGNYRLTEAIPAMGGSKVTIKFRFKVVQLQKSRTSLLPSVSHGARDDDWKTD